MKNLFGLFVVFLFCFCSHKTNGQNIALNKSYKVSTAPNYKLTGNAKGALTEGQTINSNKFWQQPTTAGWQNIKRLEIDIDLSTEESLESITFNTARGESSEVHYPRNVFPFVSEDNQDFEYVGDIA